MRMHPVTLALLTAFLIPAAASARPATAPVLVELFTSQGCSSCPPADAVLAEIAQRDDVVALAFHVTYWDRLGWRDRLGDERFTARQRNYAGMLGDGLYTPELVVAGEVDVTGSDRDGVDRALELARANRSPVALEVPADGRVALPALSLERPADLWLATWVAPQRVRIERGENAGRTIVYHRVVCDLVELGRWGGGARLVPLPALRGDGHVGVVLVAQDPVSGRVLALGRRELP